MTADNALSWARHAACRGEDLNAFFTDSQYRVAAAKQICAACLVRQTCLAEVMAAENDCRYGIYGGLTPAERHELAKTPAGAQARTSSRKRPPAKCGTNSGYARHLRTRTEICGPCRRAHADADARLRRTGTTKATR